MNEIIHKIVPSEVPEKGNLLLPNSSTLESLSLAGVFGTEITLDIGLGNEATRAARADKRSTGSLYKLPVIGAFYFVHRTSVVWS